MTRVARKAEAITEIASDVPQGLERGLRNFWYPVLQSQQLPAGRPVAFGALCEQLAAWRDAAGRPHVVHDKCPHRAAKLSAGRVLAGELQCAWHGLRFDGAGRCTLIPWEPEDSRLLQDVGVAAYPAEELGGYVWAYLGDPAKFPPPPLVESVPEELTKPGEFISFPVPADVWNASWLQCLEGSDGFHAVMLHSDSQAVAKKEWQGGRPAGAGVPLEERRMKIVKTTQGYRGVALDEQGEPIHHGHFLEGWKGERWTLPCLHTIPLKPVPNADPYVSRLYQFPIDETHTRVNRFVTWRARTDAEREQRTRLWNEVVLTRQIEVAGEDKMIVETLGDLAGSRSEEFLFYPDQDILYVRRKLKEAFLAQARGERLAPAREDLVFPV